MMNTALFQKGVDAWWLDTDEPETEGREDNILVESQTALRIRGAVREYVSTVSYRRSVRGAAGGIG